MAGPERLLGPTTYDPSTQESSGGTARTARAGSGRRVPRLGRGRRALRRGRLRCAAVGPLPQGAVVRRIRGDPATPAALRPSARGTPDPAAWVRSRFALSGGEGRVGRGGRG